jgi:Pyruvate/2-oxoacid:ferredoxin oxidoreductase gamma subunit
VAAIRDKFPAPIAEKNIAAAKEAFALATRRPEVSHA